MFKELLSFVTILWNSIFFYIISSSSSIAFSQIRLKCICSFDSLRDDRTADIGSKKFCGQNYRLWKKIFLAQQLAISQNRSWLFLFRLFSLLTPFGKNRCWSIYASLPLSLRLPFINSLNFITETVRGAAATVFCTGKTVLKNKEAIA